MSITEPGQPDLSHLDVRPGWRYLHLLPGVDEAFDEFMVEGLRRFVDQVLGDHPHQFVAGGQRAVVGLGPPDARDAERRLTHAFTTELKASDDSWDDDEATSD